MPSLQYWKLLKDSNAVMGNIKNWYAHYLYGTSWFELSKQSKRGIVYNPPGH